MKKNCFINTDTHEKRKCDKTKLEKAKELIGERFGHLLVIDIIRVPNRSREFFCKCKCDCGNIVNVPKYTLLKRKSCGNKCVFKRTPKKGDNSLGTENFIGKAIEKHGDKYNFSKTVYINRYTKISVICNKHGEFEITPQALLGNGMCPKCREETELICGVGISDYVDDKQHRNNKVWEIWCHMIQRCYADYIHKKRKTYKKVTVCKEWHRYSTFRKWYLENYIEGCDIDKDLLQHGKEYKVYSPDTVVFLPPELNCMLITNKRKRKLLIGVRHRKNRYYAYMNTRSETNKKKREEHFYRFFYDRIWSIPIIQRSKGKIYQANS